MPSSGTDNALWLRYKALRQLFTSTPPKKRKSVFVAGNQRSGTNMLMDVFERSYQTDVYHERDPRAFRNYMMLEEEKIAELHKRSRAQFFVIKALCELQDLSHLMKVFQPAKTVWILRHYHDVVNSMMRKFDGYSRQMKKIANDRDSASWRGRGMSDATHALVVKFANMDVSDESAAALQWYYRNKLFFENQFENDERVCVVFYEDLVTRPKEEFPRVFEFLGIDYTPRISQQVFASSIKKDQKPNIDPEIDVLCNDLLEQFYLLKLSDNG